jgi:hypothetical protein
MAHTGTKTSNYTVRARVVKSPVRDRAPSVSLVKEGGQSQDQTDWAVCNRLARTRLAMPFEAATG